MEQKKNDVIENCFWVVELDGLSWAERAKRAVTAVWPECVKTYRLYVLPNLDAVGILNILKSSATLAGQSLLTVATGLMMFGATLAVFLTLPFFPLFWLPCAWLKRMWLVCGPGGRERVAKAAGAIRKKAKLHETCEENASGDKAAKAKTNETRIAKGETEK